MAGGWARRGGGVFAIFAFSASSGTDGELAKVTAATVQALAADLFDTENRIEIVRIPTASGG